MAEMAVRGTMATPKASVTLVKKQFHSVRLERTEHTFLNGSGMEKPKNGSEILKKKKTELFSFTVLQPHGHK